MSNRGPATDQHALTADHLPLCAPMVCTAVYAFGILMWELYTCKAPYQELGDFNAVPALVVKQGLRPTFPQDMPTAFR